MNVLNLKLNFQSLYLSHLQKLINNHDAKWTYFARYWIGLQLRRFNHSLGSNSFPHSEYIPPFYKECLTLIDSFMKICPDFSFDISSSKLFCKILLSEISERRKIQKVCPTVNFKDIWKNIYLLCINPCVRNVMFKLCHDVIYVNYICLIRIIREIKVVHYVEKLKPQLIFFWSVLHFRL